VETNGSSAPGPKQLTRADAVRLAIEVGLKNAFNDVLEQVVGQARHFGLPAVQQPQTPSDARQRQLEMRA